jgi:hypothetical protein
MAASTIASAAARLESSGSSIDSATETSVTRFVSTSNPASAADTSLATIKSALFSRSFFLAFAIT